MEDSPQESRANDGLVSPAYSFEVLDPHDPVISRLATQLFMRTNEYLQGEMAAGQEHYSLLEEINRQGITKFADLRNFVSNLFKTVYDYERLCDHQIKPLLEQIDEIEAQVSLLEQKAYQLDAYTKQVFNLHKEILDSLETSTAEQRQADIALTRLHGYSPTAPISFPGITHSISPLRGG